MGSNLNSGANLKSNYAEIRGVNYISDEKNQCYDLVSFWFLKFFSTIINHPERLLMDFVLESDAGSNYYDS